MPWTETAPMNERMRFVTDWERDLYSMVELCERYGVSCKTGYKWVERYEREGPDGLHERSRAPHHCPHRIAADVAAAICAGRRQHPSWGPDKILHWLKRRQPELEMPATSTAGDLLARRGLVKKHRHVPGFLCYLSPRPLTQTAASHREYASLSGLCLSHVLIGKSAARALGQAR